MFSKRLKMLREIRGLTIENLAKAIGVAPITISRYENALREPELKNITRLAEYFDVSIDYLLGRTPHSNYKDLIKASQSKYGLKDYHLPVDLEEAYLEYIKTLRWILSGSKVKQGTELISKLSDLLIIIYFIVFEEDYIGNNEKITLNYLLQLNKLNSYCSMIITELCSSTLKQQYESRKRIDLESHIEESHADLFSLVNNLNLDKVEYLFYESKVDTPFCISALRYLYENPTETEEE